MADLNGKELEVLEAMIDNANSIAGGDFGIMEELSVTGMSRRVLGGHVSILGQKGFVTVHEREKINGTDWVTQFTIEEKARELWARMFPVTEAPAAPEAFDVVAFNAAVTEAVNPAPEAPAPNIARSVLEIELAMRTEEYQNLLRRLVAEACAASSSFTDNGRISSHDGSNIGRTAADLQAMAQVIESLATCIRSCK